MRFSAVALPPGWTKFTTPSAEILNVDQFSVALFVDCVTVSVLPLVVAPAMPALTNPGTLLPQTPATQGTGNSAAWSIAGGARQDASASVR